MGVAMAIGLFDVQESVAMVPTHVWDAVPSDVVTSVILAAAAATLAGIKINEYQDSPIGSNSDPMIVHAGERVILQSIAEAGTGSVPKGKACTGVRRRAGPSEEGAPLCQDKHIDHVRATRGHPRSCTCVRLQARLCKTQSSPTQ